MCRCSWPSAFWENSTGRNVMFQTPKQCSDPAKLHTWDEWLHTEAAEPAVYAKHTAMATKVTSGTWSEPLAMTRSLLFALRVRSELTVSAPLHQRSRKASANQSNVTVRAGRAALSCSSCKASEMLCLEIKFPLRVLQKGTTCLETSSSTKYLCLDSSFSTEEQDFRKEIVRVC